MLGPQSARALGGSPVASCRALETPAVARARRLRCGVRLCHSSRRAGRAGDVTQARRQAADAKAMVEGLKVDVQTIRGEVEAMKFQGDGGKLDALTQRLDALDARSAALEQARSATVVPPTAEGEVAAPVSATPAVTEGPLASSAVPPSAPPEYRERASSSCAVATPVERSRSYREFVRKSPKSDYARRRAVLDRRGLLREPRLQSGHPRVQRSPAAVPQGRQGASGAAAPGDGVRRARRQGRCTSGVAEARQRARRFPGGRRGAGRSSPS